MNAFDIFHSDFNNFISEILQRQIEVITYRSGAREKLFKNTPNIHTTVDINGERCYLGLPDGNQIEVSAKLNNLVNRIVKLPIGLTTNIRGN